MTLHLLQEIKTLQTGPWYQYDILLASRPYGWGYMLSTLDYLAGSDLDSVSEVRSGYINMPQADLTAAFSVPAAKARLFRS